MGLSGPVRIERDQGIESGLIHLIPTGQRHRLITDQTPVAILFFDPHSLMAKSISQRKLDSTYETFRRGVQKLLQVQEDQVLSVLSEIPVKDSIAANHAKHSVPNELYRDPRIATIVRTVVTEPGRYSREELANLVGISGSRLSHIFTDQVGVSLRLLSSWFRLKLAAIHLSKGASMVESALEAGFYDQSHFSNEFKKMFGLSPGNLFRSAASIQWWIQDEKSTQSILAAR